MRQILTIFRKDARHLWPQAALALFFTVAMARLDRGLPFNVFSAVVEIVWLMCWVYVGAALIQEERLPGNQQFWLTRPYDWRGLLVAKLLFLAAFAALPLMAAEAVVLAVNGISPLRHLALLVSTSATFAGGIVLVAAALAAITENLVQLMWAFLALVAIESVSAIAAPDNAGWGIIDWFRTGAVGTLIVTAGIAVLVLQYAARKTLFSRGILAGAVVLTAAVPLTDAWHAAWALESKLGSRVNDPSAVRLSFDRFGRSQVRYANAPYFPGPLQEGLYLPIRLSGIPAGTAIVSERVAAGIEAGDGMTWNSGWVQAAKITQANPFDNVDLIREDGPAWQYLNIDRAFYERVKNLPARVNVSVAILLLDQTQNGAVNPAGRTADLPLEGICEVGPGLTPPSSPHGIYNLIASCAWPRPGPVRAYVRTGSRRSNESSGFLMRSGTRGLLWSHASVWQRADALFPAREEGLELSIETWQAAAYLERKLSTPVIRLSDYAAPRPTDP